MRLRFLLLLLPLGLVPVVWGQDEPAIFSAPEAVVPPESATATLWLLGMLIATALLVATLTTRPVRRRIKKWRARAHRHARDHRTGRNDPTFEYFHGPKYLHRRHTGTGRVEMLVEKHWVPEHKARHGQPPPVEDPR